MKKSQVYFIMYIVLITELLVVITERDELHEKEQQVKAKMVKSIAEQYKRPITLVIPNPNTTKEINGDSVIVAMTPLGLVSDEEKKEVKFFVNLVSKGGDPIGSFPAGGLSEGITANGYQIVKTDDGNARFIVLKPGRAGDFVFSAYCQVTRILPSYLPQFLLDELKKEIGTLSDAKSEPVNFTIKVTAANKGDVDYVRPSLD